MELIENMKDTYGPPVFNKKEWLALPNIKHEKVILPALKNFVIEQQETKDSCGLCSGKMVLNAIIKQNKGNEKIQEKNISDKIFLSQIEVIKEYIGVTPGQLEIAIQEIISEHALPYTAIQKTMLSYEDMKAFVEAGAYIICSYMGNSIDNPYRTKNGHKDHLLKNIHHPHYVVILAINEQTKTITLANPFGFEETIPLQDFRARFSLYPKYLNSRKIYNFLVETGIYMPRSCVIVTPNT